MNKKFWISDKKKWSRAKLKRFYTALIPRITKFLNKRGYAAGIHGSLSRDLDIVAVPWTLEAIEADELAVALNKDLAKYWKSAESFKAEGYGGKPHGRKCFVILLGMHGVDSKHCASVYIDLSVMPKI